jgi:IgA Peptidase M64
MAAPPLKWKEGEGADIHLLRGGPESKKLSDALDLDPDQAAFVNFVPSILGNSSTDHGVEVTADVGIVKAGLHPSASFPKVNNFRLAAVFDDGAGNSDETAIRIHIHDSVKDIWLTPSTLSVHQGPDERRFTVLARFNDDGVGDITDWSGLTFHSNDETVVKLNGSVLQAVASSGSAPITANLTLLSPATDKTSPPATAFAEPSWAEVAKAAKVDFVAGKIVPNRADPDSTNPDSVKSVAESATNILFIGEGFRNEQRFDYRNIVNTIVRVMRGDEGAYAAAFQPFNLLKNSINYWTVFIPSREDGITVLGEHFIATLSRLIGALVLPSVRPADDATEWTFRELIHEVGLPIQADATRTLAQLATDWQQLFGPHVTEQRLAKMFQNEWNVIPFHSPLNERDSAFGMTIGHAPSADGDLSEIVEMHLNPRRTSISRFHEFVDNLEFGGFPLGARWKEDGPDSRLVCFVCLSDREAGMERGISGFFSASTGTNLRHLNLKISPNSGFDIETGPVKSTPRHLKASLVAHELAHAFSLADEYGDGAGTTLLNGSATVPGDINAQAKEAIAPAAGGNPPPFDVTKIHWLYPRITAAGVLSADLDASMISATGIRVPLRKRHGRQFAVNDVVRFWRSPVLLPASADLLTGMVFRVRGVENDAVTIVPVSVTAGSNATNDVDMNAFDGDLFLAHFSPGDKLSLIKPRRVDGSEVALVATPILEHIEVTNGPLNAPKDNPTAACVAAPSNGSVMTPTNLPGLSRIPRTKADIVGIYEGGVGHDCGVFRPAGRCRMRDNDVVTMPFCHVCRYVIVDTVDPSQHGELDKLYPEVSPLSP